MRDYKIEYYNRVAFIRDIVRRAGAKGVLFGNSGGKDSALTGALCKEAFPGDVLAVIMPCGSKRNYGEDTRDALALCGQFAIPHVTVDLAKVKSELMAAIRPASEISEPASANIAPRLRMATLYAIAQTKGYLVAGTGNASEAYMGYFTKWGDGAYDFNPIADLTVTEIYEFLRYLGAPHSILSKAPSAGLFDGQTDEREMGITYADIDHFLMGGTLEDETKMEIIHRMHRQSAHKRAPVPQYPHNV